MQITFKQGDSITIPEGCTATIKDGIITFQQQEPEQYFKDGDILIDDAKPNDATHKIIMIYKGERNSEGAYKSYILMNLSGLLVQGCCCWRCMPRREIRLATEEEKQELFDVMKEKGLRWNAAEKRVEKVRWRAEKYESYYFVRTVFDIGRATEVGWEEDNDNYNLGNYFRTREQAQAAAEAIKDVLRKFHEEND
jgi:hypothetical protein|nr:MAG TPA: hypothetical protein [Caudoviricetes sp.]